MIKEYKKYKFILIPFIIIGYIFLYNFLDKISTNILFGTFLSIYGLIFLIPNNTYYQIQNIMHTRIIKLPNFIKCFIQINKKEYYCYNEISKNNIDSQENSDIDLFTLGHFIMWFFIGYFSSKKVTYKKVLFISLLWEFLEIIGNRLNIPTNARITDVFINLSGFYLGRQYKKYIKNKKNKL